MQPSPPRLRFGVIIDRDWMPQWQLAVIGALDAGADADLAVLLRARSVGTSAAGAGAPATANRRSLWRLYNNGVVARRARCVRRAGTWAEHVPGVRVLDLDVERRGRWSDYVTEPSVAEVRAADLDFILRFGLGIVRGNVLDAARFGIWSFHHDDERVIRGGPPSFWELYDGLPTSGVLLQRLTDRLDGGIPLARATFRSVLHSYPRNRDRTALGAAELPARVARAARLGLLDPNTLVPTASDAPVRRNPTNPQMLRFLAQQTRRAIGTRTRRVIDADVWAVGIAPTEPFGAGDIPLTGIEWVPELKRSGYLADPFPATRDARTAILVEEFDEPSGRGVISALERVDGDWTLHSHVIDPGVHASYPFLLEHDGDLYCVPETAQAKRVEIWRCVDFPLRWQRAGVLVADAAVVDPTLVRHEGVWWMFGTIGDDEPDAKLSAWSAEALFGPWAPHPLNPLKIDVTSSRPAGTPFVVDGVLYRPAQDCSTSYGSGIVINRVIALDARGLVEEPAGRVTVGKSAYGEGVHTLAFGGGLCVVDGRRFGRSRHRMARELRARLRVARRGR